MAASYPVGLIWLLAELVTTLLWIVQERKKVSFRYCADMSCTLSLAGASLAAAAPIFTRMAMRVKLMS